MPDIAIIYKATEKHPMEITNEHTDILKRHNKTGAIKVYSDEDEFLNDSLDPEILLCWGQDTPDRACAKMTKLRWVQALSAGIDGLDKLKVLENKDIVLGKMKNVHGIVMAQTCLTYILMFQRSIPGLIVQKREHLWKKPSVSRLRDSNDITVGIYGMGDIGSDVAKLCKKMGMTVLACRRTPVLMDNVDCMYSMDRLYEMLPLCDFVVDLVPDTPASRNSVNLDFFKNMKKDAVFINIGRGATVNTEDLIIALQQGVIAGAALDAVMPEPLNEDSPLWDMENVIITPHCSADNPNYFKRAFEVIANSLCAYQAGEMIPTAVSR